MSSIKFSTKRIFPNFHILKINRMMSFCNLFMERPSYGRTFEHALLPRSGSVSGGLRL